jgi:hypothetical protein
MVLVTLPKSAASELPERCMLSSSLSNFLMHRQTFYNVVGTSNFEFLRAATSVLKRSSVYSMDIDGVCVVLQYCIVMVSTARPETSNSLSNLLMHRQIPYHVALYIRYFDFGD